MFPVSSAGICAAFICLVKRTTVFHLNEHRSSESLLVEQHTDGLNEGKHRLSSIVLVSRRSLLIATGDQVTDDKLVVKYCVHTLFP